VGGDGGEIDDDSEEDKGYPGDDGVGGGASGCVARKDAELAEKEAEAADSEADAHEAEAGTDPGEEGALGGEVDAGIVFGGLIHGRSLDAGMAEGAKLGGQFGGGPGVAEGFGGLFGVEALGGDELQQPGVGFGQAGGGDGGEQGSAEVGGVESRGDRGVEGLLEAKECGGAAVLGEDEGCFTGEVVAAAQEGGDPGQRGVAVEAEDAADAGGEQVGVFAVAAGGAELGAEAKEEGGGVGTDLLDGAGGVDADGEVGVVEEGCEVAEEDGRGEVAALDQGECAGAAEGSGGVGGASPGGFELEVFQAGEEEGGVLILESGKGTGELVLGPALGVGFDGVSGRHEALEGFG
jgi:hypothetical protein